MRDAWSGGGELVGSAGVRWRAADCATAASVRSRGRAWYGLYYAVGWPGFIS
jgi:hypothetical protein